MRPTIRKAGRLVIPKSRRDGGGRRSSELQKSNGRLVIPATGQPISIDDVRSLGEADQP